MHEEGPGVPFPRPFFDSLKYPLQDQFVRSAVERKRTDCVFPKANIYFDFPPHGIKLFQIRDGKFFAGKVCQQRFKIACVKPETDGAAFHRVWVNVVEVPTRDSGIRAVFLSFFASGLKKYPTVLFCFIRLPCCNHPVRITVKLLRRQVANWTQGGFILLDAQDKIQIVNILKMCYCIVRFITSSGVCHTSQAEISGTADGGLPGGNRPAYEEIAFHCVQI